MENTEEQKDIALEEAPEVTTTENDAQPIVVEEGQPEVQEEPAAAPKPQHSEAQKLRFDVLREARLKAERERDVLKEQLERARRQQAPVEQPKPQEEVYSVAPDDLVEGKHLSKYDREIEKLRSELNTYKKQTTTTAIETRVQSQYPDFNSVVTQENLEMLSSAYPEIAATLNSSSDLYNTAVSAYTMIKKLGIVENPIHEKKRSIAQVNSAKPRPIAAVNAQPGGDSPLTKANAFSQGSLSSEEKDQLYREILEAKRNRY